MYRGPDGSAIPMWSPPPTVASSSGPGPFSMPSRKLGYFERLRIGWQLTKVSLGILRKEKGLIVLPFLSLLLTGGRLARLPDLDLLLHCDSDESIRVLALLRRPRDRVLRHVFRVDLLQRGRHGRRDDPIERRRPDGLGRPESREPEPEADRGMGARERDRRTGPPGHR